jgi:hypothetical protein
MSSCTPFIKAEWVSVGKKWNDIPPRVRRACTEDDEPVFSAETDQGDGSDIPIDVVRSVVMAEGSVVDGYKLDEEGSIVRTGVAENEEQQAGEDDAEASVIVPAAELGRGRRVKIGSKRFNAEWEEH